MTGEARPESYSAEHTDFHLVIVVSHFATLFSNDGVFPMESVTFMLASGLLAVPKTVATVNWELNL